jgi:hypothetical protein
VSLCFNRAPRHEGILGEWRYSFTHSWSRHRLRGVVSFTSLPLYPQRKSLCYLLGRRMCGPQNRSGRGGEDKNSRPLPELEPPIIQPVVQRYTTELYITLYWNRIIRNEELYCPYWKLMRWNGSPADKMLVGKSERNKRLGIIRRRCEDNLWATGWTIGVLGFDSLRGLGIFLFPTASRTALGPTQPPVQWVPGILFLGVKRPGRKTDHSPPSSAKVKECVELYLHSPNTPSWRGA